MVRARGTLPNPSRATLQYDWKRPTALGSEEITRAAGAEAQ
jgi:hypothetical protein